VDASTHIIPCWIVIVQPVQYNYPATCHIFTTIIFYSATYDDQWNLILVLFHMNASSVFSVIPDYNNAAAHGMSWNLSCFSMDNYHPIIHCIPNTILRITMYHNSRAIHKSTQILSRSTMYGYNSIVM
jgi:hypothetical protein